MKIRNGFVSNSSSSSFIATIVMVEDQKKFNDWKSKSNFEDVSELKILRGIDIVEDSYIINRWDDFFEKIDWDKISKLAGENPDNLFVIKMGIGPNDDSFFWNGEYYDYDIAITEFKNDDVDFYNAPFEQNGMKLIYQTYYAGRDG